MNKRFQVFISSTFIDLIEERQSVLKGILELDHMPAGMELFPASDDTAWQLIKEVIDSSDYYVLIIGGRYGSLDSEGISYTEKEYDYAVESRKAVIPLLHKTPDNLPRDKTETDPDQWARLSDFRSKVEDKHTCVFWETPDELKSQVIVGVTSAIKRAPAPGWIRADEVPSSATVADLLKLRDRVAELEKELEEVQTKPPVGSEDLLQGEDTVEMSLSFNARDPNDHFGTNYRASLKPTWDSIFAGVAPSLIDEAPDTDFRAAMRTFLGRIALEEFQDREEFKDSRLGRFQFKDHEIDTCVVQLRAIGLISESQKKRSVRDTKTYWTLTPYGDQRMVQLRALRKSSEKNKTLGGHASPTSQDGA